MRYPTLIAALFMVLPAAAADLDNLEPGNYVIMKVDANDHATPYCWYSIPLNQAQPVILPIQPGTMRTLAIDDVLQPFRYTQQQQRQSPPAWARMLSGFGPRSHAAYMERYYGIYEPVAAPQTVIHQMPGLLQAPQMQQVPPLQMMTPQTQLYSNGSQFGSATTFGNSTLLNGPLFQGR